MKRITSCCKEPRCMDPHDGEETITWAKKVRDVIRAELDDVKYEHERRWAMVADALNRRNEERL